MPLSGPLVKVSLSSCRGQEWTVTLNLVKEMDNIVFSWNRDQWARRHQSKKHKITINHHFWQNRLSAKRCGFEAHCGAGWYKPKVGGERNCEKKVVRHGVEESKASLCAHTQQFVGLCVQRCYVEDSRSMWLHPTPSHRGLWRAAILVKPTSVSAGGFNTAPFPSPRCGSSLLKLPEKSHFTTFERRSHVGECSCCRCCRRKITIMQHM